MTADKLRAIRREFNVRVDILCQLARNAKFNPMSYGDRKAFLYQGKPLSRQPQKYTQRMKVPCCAHRSIVEQLDLRWNNALVLLKEAIELDMDIRKARLGIKGHAPCFKGALLSYRATEESAWQFRS